ncbi:MAG: hypothetical protein FWE71_13530 [Nocardioidaceae bacterium]|nr:hypothetical protein [Nocardioidaceae bacterium]MCL2614203.1 hypothetical protein [Nocardioidaceae bacterium]
MSPLSILTSLMRGAVRGAARVVVHPQESAAAAVEIARDTASGLRDAAARAEPEPETRSERAAAPVTEGPAGPQPADQIAPEPTPDPVATEPKPSAGDDWEDEIDDGPDLELIPGAADDDEPLLDTSIAKAVRSESETLRKGAETDTDEVNDH